jgi:23S rRNA (adenine2503-C2)-methyltransferase
MKNDASIDSAPLVQLTTPRPLGGQIELLGLTFEALVDHLERWGVGARHAKRVFRALHVTHTPLLEVPNLGRHAHTILARSKSSNMKLTNRVRSSDGTQKLLFSLEDGGAVEAVLLPMRRERYTLCLSTQVGCAMKCSFCATGTLGLKRSLTVGEVVAQVYAARQLISSGLDEDSNTQAPRALSHLVFMGMGEPLHTYERTRDALRILLDQRGCSFASRQVTVSTVGLASAMRRFSKDFSGRVQLALSLHAGTDATREKIIPVAKKWPLDVLKEALLAHPLPGKRVLMLEYVVLPGINDSDAELDGVARFYQGLRALVNLIPFNPFTHAPFRSPTPDEVESVERRLKARGVPCSVRVTRGQDRDGACGQLAIQGFS